MSSEVVVSLKPGKEKSLRRLHPWLFTGAVANVSGKPGIGETVVVHDSEGAVLGRAAWSPMSKIQARVWTFIDEAVDEAWFRTRLTRAIAGRARYLAAPGPVGVRLVNAESDGLPGLIVDRYGDFLVMQCLSAGPDLHRAMLARLLLELTDCSGVFERSDVDVRSKEGLAPRTGVLLGDTPPARISIREGVGQYFVDVHGGHKTGFYLDQRDSRAALAAVATGEVLNCFSYSGSFGVAALLGGATHVTNMDSSVDALAIARDHLALNGLAEDRATFEAADVFHALRRYRDSRRTFDTIILDPPKFADSREHVDAACRGYKDINLLGLKLIRSGGLLLTFSCSGLVDRELFTRTVAFAAMDAGREVQVLKLLEQPMDHPSTLAFPEAHYLTGLLLRVY